MIHRTSESIHSFTSLKVLSQSLKNEGCTRCSLGKQKNLKAPVLFRGNPDSKYIIFGEAPGKEEDLAGMPFIGPAGELLDKIFASVGIDTNTWYVGNVVLCRPIASRGSGRENLTPTSEALEACSPYREQVFKVLNPKIVVLAGLSAAKGILGHHVSRKTMYELGGKFIEVPEFNNTKFFTIYHPAALLHVQRNVEAARIYKQKMWQHIKLLKNEIDRLESRKLSYPELESKEANYGKQPGAEARSI